jgi:NADH-quinone oxidoreductase subunit L
MLAWIPLLPLMGFALNGLWYLFFQSREGQKPAGSMGPGVIASLAIGGAFVASLLGFLQLQSMDPAARVIEQTLFSWMEIPGALKIDMSLRFDALSSLFCLVITGVGTLIHIYSIGYMADDETPGKYFAYLNLFCFSMLMLVLGASLPVLFLGWEGVGLCSYLLIGYWYTDDAKASAGKKAFIVNRIGDLGFLLGMFILFFALGTLDFVGMKAALPQANLAPAMITAVCLLLFVGCTGKSAQIPLYVWLPDAMAGPTPVSALIHAATMVTSGVYLIARMNFFFDLSPTALEVIAWTGGLTALFAATMAIAQTDIKKVLAYSTVSQLGYMFLACGVAAYSTGVFHVITHAFFKALMFLGAGSVIYGMHHEQDILKMGGLKKYMPKTHFVFMIGWLAICGIPPFSGFFSKDEVLWHAFANTHGGVGLWLLGAITAILTAFYMTRLYVLTFHGKFRGDAHSHSEHAHKPHETPMLMVAPLIVLAILSGIGGFMGIPHMSWLAHWLEPVIPHHAGFRPGVEPAMEWALMGLSVFGAIVGISVAWKIFSNLKTPEKLKKKHAGVHRLLSNKWYVDELYEHIVVEPIHKSSMFLWKKFDIAIIDRVVLGFGRVSSWTGSQLRVIQSGSLQVYALMLLVGLVITLGYVVYGIVG